GFKADSLSDGIADILRNLRWRPNLAARGLIICHAVAWLHGRVRHHRQFVYRFDATSVGFGNIARRVAGRSFLTSGLVKRLSDGGGAQVFVRAFVPGDSEDPAAFHRGPHIVGDDDDRGVADFGHVGLAGHFPRLAIVELRNFTANYGTTREHGVFHIGQAEINTVTGGAVYLGRSVQAQSARADNLVIFGVFQRRIGRYRKGCSAMGKPTVAGAATGRSVDH